MPGKVTRGRGTDPDRWRLWRQDKRTQCRACVSAGPGGGTTPRDILGRTGAIQVRAMVRGQACLNAVLPECDCGGENAPVPGDKGTLFATISQMFHQERRDNTTDMYRLTWQMRPNASNGAVSWETPPVVCSSLQLFCRLATFQKKKASATPQPTCPTPTCFLPHSTGLLALRTSFPYLFCPPPGSVASVSVHEDRNVSVLSIQFHGSEYIHGARQPPPPSILDVFITPKQALFSTRRPCPGRRQPLICFLFLGIGLLHRTT